MSDHDHESPLARLCREYGIEPGIFRAPGTPTTNERDARYTIEGELGRGSFGRVAAARDRDLRRSVAIKILDRRVSDVADIQAFLEEAMITGNLEHPNIIPAYELNYSPSLGLYYTMKRFSGHTLRQLLDDLRSGSSEIEASFGLFRRLIIFGEIGRALAFAHERGIIHADLKPEHVLLGQLGGVVVADWGLARVLGPEGRGQSCAYLDSGTPLYMSPEQITDEATELDERTDIWSLGVILYELLTLSPPFSGLTEDAVFEAVLTDRLVPPSLRAPKARISPHLDEMCAKALTKSREHRYQTVAALLDDLHDYLEGTRERARRTERAHHVRSEAERLFASLETTEAAVDQHVSEADPDLLCLEVDRETLLAGYRRARDMLEDGLSADPEDTRLLSMAGDLYWRIFTRIYPSGVRPSDPLAERALQILVSLTERWTSAVVSEGRKRNPPDERTEDPWLDVVRALCAGERLRPEESPSELRAVVERLGLLTGVSLFRSVASSELLALAEACHEVKLSQGEKLFSRGEPATHLYFVRSGEVTVIRDGIQLSRIGPGGIFGEVGVLGSHPRTADIVAAAPTRCLAVGAKRFRALIREHPDIGLAVMEVLADRLNAATAKEAALRNAR